MGCGSKNEEIRVCGQKCHFSVSAATFLKIIRILRFFGVFTFLCDLIFHILLYFLLKLTKNNKSFVYSVTVSPSDLDLWYEVDDE